MFRRIAKTAPFQVIWETTAACLRFRALGLAAESAFFMLLSIPPLLFGLVGTIGYIAQAFSIQSRDDLRIGILQSSEAFLTEDVINRVLAPMLDEAFTGRIDVMSIGFLLSLWAGSRAIAVFLDTVSIMYGFGGERGIVKTRALSVGLYAAFLVMAAVLLPLIITGPDLLERMLPEYLQWLLYLYWPVVAIGSMITIKVFYTRAVPQRRRWWVDLPGALLAFAIWLLGSAALRLFVSNALGGSMLYGPLSAPIALLLWLHVISLALLIGAAFNAALEKHLPMFRSPNQDNGPEQPISAPNPVEE